jgi:hypothetical protein
MEKIHKREILKKDELIEKIKKLLNREKQKQQIIE